MSDVMPAVAGRHSDKGAAVQKEIAMYLTGRFLVTSILVLLFMSPGIGVSTTTSATASPPVATQTVVPLAPFSSVELRNGAVAILRYGAIPHVTLLKGTLDYTAVMVESGLLVVDKCKSRCPRGYELEIEIVTPDIARISVAHGGTIQSRGHFPRQTEISVAVSQGGTIDIRSMAMGRVTASVEQGGRIFTMAHIAMFASVVNGGNITYWGDADVKSSVHGGGSVTKGTEAEADKALSKLNPPLPFVPPTPPVPPIPPVRPKR
jgi:hypothetical protein